MGITEIGEIGYGGRIVPVGKPPVGKPPVPVGKMPVGLIPVGVGKVKVGKPVEKALSLLPLLMGGSGPYGMRGKASAAPSKTEASITLKEVCMLAIERALFKRV